MSKPLGITHARLAAQHLVNNPLAEPVEVVGYLGAVQAQDLNAAKWAIAQRTTKNTEADIETAFAKGKILRTHVLRPTWHFVRQNDIRWMLELTAPRIKAVSAYYFSRIGIDNALLGQSNNAIAHALNGGVQLTKAELCEVLMQSGIDTSDALRITYLIMNAEIDGLICSGAPRGKQQTYALLSDRAPNAKSLPRDEALTTLATTYFVSHGPATLKDFVWWSGLSKTDGKKALTMAAPSLTHTTIGGHEYWQASSAANAQTVKLVQLMSCYDEYIIAYADRSAAIDSTIVKKVDERNNILFNHTVVVDGIVRGVWRRAGTRKTELQVQLFNSFSNEERAALESAIQSYASYLQIALVPHIVQL